MESPLTPGLVEELKKISQLNIEEQKKVLPSFLKKLTPEQIEYIKKQQGQEQGGCLFCSMINGDIPIKKIYEDDELLAFLDIRPANLGHALVISKEHIQFSTQLDETKIFDIANKIAKAIYENLKKDTNIFVANGVNAGQRLDHLAVHIIPRDKDDGVSIGWQGKEVKEEELNRLVLLLGIKAEKKEKPKVEEVVEEIYYDDMRIP